MVFRKAPLVRMPHSARIVTVLLMTSGCGEDFGSPADVSGTITLDGAPVSEAQITFYSLAGDLPPALRTRSGRTDAQGVYAIGEVYPAEYQVRVEKAAEYSTDPGKAPAVPTSAGDPLVKFGSESPLKARVSPDTASFDFELAAP